MLMVWSVGRWTRAKHSFTAALCSCSGRVSPKRVGHHHSRHLGSGSGVSDLLCNLFPLCVLQETPAFTPRRWPFRNYSKPGCSRPQSVILNHSPFHILDWAFTSWFLFMEWSELLGICSFVLFQQITLEHTSPCTGAVHMATHWS